MWNHIQPHLYSNATQLALDMTKNKDFAKVRILSNIESRINALLEAVYM